MGDVLSAVLTVIAGYPCVIKVIFRIVNNLGYVTAYLRHIHINILKGWKKN